MSEGSLSPSLREGGLVFKDCSTSVHFNDDNFIVSTIARSVI